jgi:hypothetical protein
MRLKKTNLISRLFCKNKNTRTAFSLNVIAMSNPVIDALRNFTDAGHIPSQNIGAHLSSFSPAEVASLNSFLARLNAMERSSPARPRVPPPARAVQARANVSGLNTQALFNDNFLPEVRAKIETQEEQLRTNPNLFIELKPLENIQFGVNYNEVKTMDKVCHASASLIFSFLPLTPLLYIS